MAANAERGLREIVRAEAEELRSLRDLVGGDVDFFCTAEILALVWQERLLQFRYQDSNKEPICDA